MWQVKVNRRKITLHRTGRRVKIYFKRKWRPCKNTGGKWYLWLGRKWEPVRKRNVKRFVRYKHRMVPLPRKAGMRIKFEKTWAILKRLRQRLYLRAHKKWLRVRFRSKNYILFHGRRLRVKRRGRQASVLYHRKWSPFTRTRRRRPRQICKL